MNYIVCSNSQNSDDKIVYTQEQCCFQDTRDAIKWIKENGEDGVSYTILKLAKALEVQTVKYKKIVETGK